MAYEVVMPYHLHMPSYFLETFTEYPNIEQAKKLHSSFVVFYFVFVLWLFLDVSRGTVFFMLVCCILSLMT